ncbi:MAG: hypothetical protein A2788_02250, partial [Candidatus Abawacabacteria bacterium RIFCSPHIGHO2_01_FULL_46_8]
MALAVAQLEKLLLENQLLTKAILTEAKQLAQKQGISLEELLVQEGMVPEERLGELMAADYGVPFIDLKGREIEDAVLRFIPENIAAEQKMIAFAKEANSLKVALADPGNVEVISFLAKKTGFDVQPHYAHIADIKLALERYHKEIKQFEDIIASNVEKAQRLAAKGGENLEAIAQDLPVVEIVQTLLENAYRKKASDIHIEPHGEEVIVRYRIDGVLQDILTLPKQISSYLVTRIKVLANLRTDLHYAPQDGRFQETVEGEDFSIRVSILPTYDGEKVVMRLLSQKSREYTLDSLGFSPLDLAKVKHNIARPYGMILVTGPTGSGKTTSLYSIIKVLNTREVNISTVEDPIEYSIPGINQTQVNPKTNLTFANGLRFLLRQDPDIMMIGEIRDEETAKLAINAAMTGHIVLSTLHTNNASVTLPRLLEMGVELYLIAATVKIAIAQRLVRRVCPECSQDRQFSQAELNAIRENFDLSANFLQALTGQPELGEMAQSIAAGKDHIITK